MVNGQISANLEGAEQPVITVGLSVRQDLDRVLRRRPLRLLQLHQLELHQHRPQLRLRAYRTKLIQLELVEDRTCTAVLRTILLKRVVRAQVTVVQQAITVVPDVSPSKFLSVSDRY